MCDPSEHVHHLPSLHQSLRPSTQSYGETGADARPDVTSPVCSALKRSPLPSYQAFLHPKTHQILSHLPDNNERTGGCRGHKGSPAMQRSPLGLAYRFTSSGFQLLLPHLWGLLLHKRECVAARIKPGADLLRVILSCSFHCDRAEFSSFHSAYHLSPISINTSISSKHK